MDTLGDLVARERRSDDTALVAPRENRRYDYHRFCNTAWKTGNFWRRRGVHASDEVASVSSSDERRESDGVHADATVAVADEPDPEVVFSFLGAALLGARTRFGLPDAATPIADVVPDARVVVAPHDEIAAYAVPPGCQRVAYAGPPDDPGIAHFERDVWSENPAFPETALDSATTGVVADGREFSHADLLSAASTVVDDWGLQSGDEVAVRAPLGRPGAVVAGVVAPLLAGAAILLPDDEAIGDVAVVAGSQDAERTDVPESETLEASTVT